MREGMVPPNMSVCTEEELADYDQNDRQQPVVNVDILVSTPSNSEPTHFLRSAL